MQTFRANSKTRKFVENTQKKQIAYIPHQWLGTATLLLLVFLDFWDFVLIQLDKGWILHKTYGVGFVTNTNIHLEDHSCLLGVKLYLGCATTKCFKANIYGLSFVGTILLVYFSILTMLRFVPKLLATGQKTVWNDGMWFCACFACNFIWRAGEM